MTKRGFVVPEGMAELVKGAKVGPNEAGEGAKVEEKPPEAEKPADPAQPPVEPEKTPPAPAPQAAEVKKPWEVASCDPTAINFRPELSLHAKMEWVCNTVPKMSRLRILREGAELLCNQLIEKHGK